MFINKPVIIFYNVDDNVLFVSNVNNYHYVFYASNEIIIFLINLTNNNVIMHLIMTLCSNALKYLFVICDHYYL